MQQRQSARHERVFQAGEPSRLLLRQGLDVVTQRLDEEQLGQFCQHRLRAGPARADLVRGELERALHPVGGAATPSIEAQHRRQDAGKEIAFEALATEEAAHNARGLAAAAMTDHQKSAIHRRAHDLSCRYRRQVEMASQNVRMIVGKDDDLAGLDIDRLEMRDLRAQPALDYVVVENEVIDAVEQRAAILRDKLGADAPRCSELGVKKYTALETHEAQHVGEGIHGSAFATAGGLCTGHASGGGPQASACKKSRGQISPFSKTSPGTPA